MIVILFSRGIFGFEGFAKTVVIKIWLSFLSIASSHISIVLEFWDLFYVEVNVECCDGICRCILLGPDICELWLEVDLTLGIEKCNESSSGVEAFNRMLDSIVYWSGR